LNFSSISLKLPLCAKEAVMSRYSAHKRRQVMSLDGIWDFAFLGSQNPGEIDPAQIQYNDRMAVPGCFDATPAYAGKRGLAAYRVRLWLPDAALHRVVFNAVHHWCRVFANGTALRDHGHGFGRFQVDLPRRAGAVELVVLVDNRFNSERSPLHMDHFDWYQFGGITRPVELHRLGEVSIEGLRVVTERLDLPSLHLVLDYRASKAETQTTLRVEVDGRSLVQESVTLAARGGRLERMLELPGATLWSPAAPHLHEVSVTLADDDLCLRVGLRQVRVAGRQILINEQPIRLKGFNRHESHPEFGHALPDQLIAADVQQLRDLGCNFVRGSHYPQDERFLELCDEVGICVWVEGIGWQQKAENLTDDHFMQAQLGCLDEMVRMSQNHPSVIIYGILNESQSSDPAARRAYARLFGRLRELDSSRPLTYATHQVFEDLCLDLADLIAVNTYPGWYFGEIEDIPARLDEIAVHLDEIGQGNKPLILSEIGAAAVAGWRDWNEDRWSEQYQARLLETVIRHVLMKDDRFAGLSIWQFCDVRSASTIARMMNRARGYNNKGVVDEYRRPKLAYETVKQLFHQVSAPKE
jgi:beta-glucuronidase